MSDDDARSSRTSRWIRWRSGPPTTSRRSTATRSTLEIPTANLVAAITPTSPRRSAMRRRRRAQALRQPVDGPTVRRAPGRQVEHRGRDRQPVPSHALVEAPAARVRRDRGRRDHRRPGRLRERQGLPHVRVGHGAEARPREPGADGGERLGVPPERSPERGRLHLRRRLVGRHAGVAAHRGRNGGAQDHDRPGAGEPLGRGRRRQADPARRRLGCDDRVESLRLRHLAADPLRRVCRARCARTSTRWRRCAASTAR